MGWCVVVFVGYFYIVGGDVYTSFGDVCFLRIGVAGEWYKKTCPQSGIFTRGTVENGAVIAYAS